MGDDEGHVVGRVGEVAEQVELQGVGGLVQVPCIERNAIGGVKAINAARLAKLGDGTNIVTLDDVVETMAATGRDMMTKYKETSMGGLAVNVAVNYVEC